MKQKELATITTQLRLQREALVKETLDAEATLQFIAEDREAELEERAQEDRAARLYADLDTRAKLEIELIDAALRRIADGTYGICGDCGEPISTARLHALLATPFCIDCAKAHEAQGRLPLGDDADIPQHGTIPADLHLLSGRELETAVRDLVREDGRIDTDELRIVCRHGVVFLHGALPSESEHQILRKLITDVGGLHELVDRVEIKEILWDRSERDKFVPAELPAYRPEPPQTEDLVENLEDGIEYGAPAGPTSDEE